MVDYETKSIPQELESGNYVKLKNEKTGEEKLILKAFLENVMKTNGDDSTWLVLK